MRYPIINTKNYYIDYLTINYEIPYINNNKIEKALLSDEHFKGLEDELKYLRNSSKRKNPSITNAHRWLAHVYKILQQHFHDPKYLTHKPKNWDEKKFGKFENTYFGGLSNHYDFLKGLRFQQDHTHLNLKIIFSGKFFCYNELDNLVYHNGVTQFSSSMNVHDDFKSIQHWFTQVDNIIQKDFKEWQSITDIKSAWHSNFISSHELNHTISRIDIATHSNKTSFKLPYKIHTKSKNIYYDETTIIDGKKYVEGDIKKRGDIAQKLEDITTNETTAIVISKPDESNIPRRDVSVYFRCYNKRWTTEQEQIEASTKRFGNFQFIRKEWELKREFLHSKVFGLTEKKYRIINMDLLARHFDKDDPHYKPYYFQNVVIAFRQNKDITFKNDDKITKALHDISIQKYEYKNQKVLNWSSFKRFFSVNYNVYDDLIPIPQITKKSWDGTKSILGIANTFDNKTPRENIEKCIKALKEKLKELPLKQDIPLAESTEANNKALHDIYNLFDWNSLEHNKIKPPHDFEKNEIFNLFKEKI